MKKKSFIKKDYSFKRRRVRRVLVLFVPLVLIPIFILLSQKPDETYADSKSECLAKASNPAEKQTCNWYDSQSDYTSVSTEWLSGSPDCSYGATVKVSKDTPNPDLYVCTAVFTGAKDSRSDAEFTAYNINFDASGTDYITNPPDTLGSVQGNGHNQWTTTSVTKLDLDGAKIYEDYKAGTLDNCIDYKISSDMRVSDQKKTINTTAKSPLCFEVEPEPEKECPEGTTPRDAGNGKIICDVSVEESYSSRTVVSQHTTLPGTYTPWIVIDKLNAIDVTSFSPKEVYNSTTNPQTRWTLVPNLVSTFDFWPDTEDPITTTSLAGVSSLLTMTNAIDFKTIIDDIDLCGEFNINFAAEAVTIGGKVIKYLVDWVVYAVNTRNGVEAEEPTSTVTAEDIETATMLAQQVIICNAAVAEPYLESTIKAALQNIENKPPYTVAEGSLYLDPGEDGWIYAYVIMPSNMVYYTYTVVYTQNFTERTTTSTDLDTEETVTDTQKILTSMTSNSYGFQRHFQQSDTLYEVHDKRHVRRNGHFYGVSFTTRLDKLDTGSSYHGNTDSLKAVKDVSATASKLPGPTDNDNDVTKVTTEYNQKIFAGSDNEDSIVATFSHGATAKSDDTLPQDACPKMAKFGIPWYVDGSLRDGSTLTTEPFNLASSGTACQNTVDPLSVSGSNTPQGKHYETNEVEIKNDKIGLGDSKEFSQEGHIASQYTYTYGNLSPKKRDLLGNYNKIPAQVKFKVYRPWNYDLSITDIIIDGTKNGVLANTGEPIAVTVKAKNEENKDPNQEGNPSYSPETTVSLFKLKFEKKDQVEIEGINNCLTSKINPSCSIGSAEHIYDWKAQLGYGGGTFSETYGDDEASSKVGDHICYFARLNYSKSTKDASAIGGKYGYNPLSNNYVYSGLTCFTLIGFPTTEIWGGNVYSEGDIKTKVYEHGNYIFAAGAKATRTSSYALGSWADYGIISKGNIVGLASSKSLPRNKTGNASISIPVYDCDNHRLTINNNGCSATSNTPPEDNVTNIGNSIINSPRTKTKILSTYRGESDKYDYEATTVISSAGTLPNGRTKVFYSSGDIVINTDMKPYAASYSKVSDIPQYIVIAEGNINIAKNVTEVDAWLVANGTINTCTEADGARNEANFRRNEHDYYKEECGNKLTINGPVYANKINLQRTRYDNKTDTLAEKFDVSAFSFYWAYSQSSLGGKASTAYMRNLPPRY